MVAIPEYLRTNSFPSAFKIVRTICGTIIADTGGEISKAQAMVIVRLYCIQAINTIINSGCCWHRTHPTTVVLCNKKTRDVSVCLNCFVK